MDNITPETNYTYLHNSIWNLQNVEEEIFFFNSENSGGEGDEIIVLNAKLLCKSSYCAHISFKRARYILLIK